METNEKNKPSTNKNKIVKKTQIKIKNDKKRQEKHQKQKIYLKNKKCITYIRKKYKDI